MPKGKDHILITVAVLEKFYLPTSRGRADKGSIIPHLKQRSVRESKKKQPMAF